MRNAYSTKLKFDVVLTFVQWSVGLVLLHAIFRNHTPPEQDGADGLQAGASVDTPIAAASAGSAGPPLAVL